MISERITFIRPRSTYLNQDITSVSLFVTYLHHRFSFTVVCSNTAVMSWCLPRRNREKMTCPHLRTNIPSTATTGGPRGAEQLSVMWLPQHTFCFLPVTVTRLNINIYYVHIQTPCVQRPHRSPPLLTRFESQRNESQLSSWGSCWFHNQVQDRNY